MSKRKSPRNNKSRGHRDAEQRPFRRGPLGLESLEDRIAPAVLTYEAPLGAAFAATLRASGSDLQLIDASNNVLKHLALADTTGVVVTGADRASQLTIDVSTPLDFPVRFASAAGADPSLNDLRLVRGADVILSNVNKIGGALELANTTLTFQNVTGTSSGTVEIAADHASLFSAGSIEATIQDGPDADTSAVVGSYDLATQTFGLDGDQLDVSLPQLEVAAQTVHLSYTLNGPADQQIARVESVIATFPRFEGVEATVEGLTLRGDGFSLDNGSVAVDSLTLGGFLNLTTPRLTLSAVNYTAASGSAAESFTGTIGVSADEAALFPGGAFTGVVTDLEGTFTLATQRFSLRAGELGLGYEGFFTAHASGVVFGYDPSASGSQNLVTLAQIDLTVEPLNDLHVTAHNLVLRTDGFSFDDLAVQQSTLSFGSFLALTAPTVRFTDFNFSTGTGTTPAGFTGALTVSADTARLFPGRTFTGSLTATATQPGVSASFDFNTLAFGITTGDFSLSVSDAVTVEGSGLALGYDPSSSAEQTLAVVNNATVRFPRFNVSGSINHFVLTTSGFSFGSASITVGGTRTIGSAANPILRTEGLTVALTNFGVRYGSGFSIQGALTVSAGRAAVFPNGSAFSATATNLSGGFSFSNAGVGSLTLGAGTFDLNIASRFSLNATNFVLNPDGPVVLSVGSVTARIPALNLSGTVTDLAITSGGAISVSGFSLTTSGFFKSLRLGKFLPLDLTGVSVRFPDSSNNLANFELTVSGTVNGGFFRRLPFKPVIQIGQQSGTSSANYFSFTVAIEDGELVPVNLGPITLGVKNLKIGPVTLGGSIFLGGYQNRQFVPSVGGSFYIEAEKSGASISNEINVNGTLRDGALSIIGSNILSFNLFDQVEVQRGIINFGLDFRDTGSGMSVRPSIGQVSAQLIKINVADIMTFQARNVILDFGATGSQPIIRFGGNILSAKANGTYDVTQAKDGELSAVFGPSAGPLANWGGAVGNFAIGADGSFQLLNGFNISLMIGNTPLGLPSFLPIEISKVKVKFNEGAIVNGQLVDASNFSIVATGSVLKSFPLYGGFKDLTVNVHKLKDALSGNGNPFDAIEGLNGFSIGIQKLKLGLVEINGGMALGKVDFNGSSSFYMRIHGRFKMTGYSGGIDIAFSQYGPLIATLSGGGADPITGITVEFENVGFVFGLDPFPSITDPQDIFTNVAFQNPTEISDDVLIDALEYAVTNHQLTWDRGFSLIGSARITDMYAASMVSAHVQIAANIGLQGDNAGLKILAKGSGEVYGFPVATLAMLLDFSKPLVPRVLVAFVMPDPDNPLSILFPVKATLSATLDTTGVITLPIVGLSTFFTEVTNGLLNEGQQLFSAIFRDIAAEMEADHDNDLAKIILSRNNVFDSDGEAIVTEEENRAVITPELFTRRVLEILTPDFQNLTDANRLRQCTFVVKALLPELFTKGAAYFGGNIGPIAQRLSLIFIQAGIDAITAGWQQFNPSLIIQGAIQPQLFGMAFGDPDTIVDVLINKRGISFDLEGSLYQTLLVGGHIPIPKQLILLHDQTTFAFTLPFPGEFLLSLITGKSPLLNTKSTAEFLKEALNEASQWQVFLSVTAQTAGGFNLGTAYGYIFGPQAQVNGVYEPTKLFRDKVIVLDPNNTGKPDPAILARIAKTPDLIGVPSLAKYKNVMKYGGILFGGQLSLPDFVIDPVEWVKSSISPVNIWTSNLPTGALDTEGITKYITRIKDWLLRQEIWGMLNAYIPGPLGLIENPSATYFTGFADLKLVGIPVANARIDLVARDNPDGSSSSGLIASGGIPWLGDLKVNAGIFEQHIDPATFLEELVSSPFASALLKPALGGAYDAIIGIFDSMKGRLPAIPFATAATEGTVSFSGLKTWFANSLRLPASIFTTPGVDAQASIGIYTPGWDLTAPVGSIKHNGGMVIDASMNIVGLVDNAKFRFEIQPFSFLQGTDFATAVIPMYYARASVDHLGLPALGSAGRLLSLDNFLIEMEKNATGLYMRLDGELYFLNGLYRAQGYLQLNDNGLWGSLRVDANSGWLFGPVSFHGVLSVDINLTLTPQRGFNGTIPAVTARVYQTGTLEFGDLEIDGTFGYSAGLAGLFVLAEGGVVAGPLGHLRVRGLLGLDPGGLYGRLLVDSGVNAGTFALDGVIVLGVNSTNHVVEDLAPLSFQYVASGSLSLRNLAKIDGTFILTVQPKAVSIYADGTVVVPVFGSLQASGAMLLDDDGLAGSLSMNIGGGLSGPGFAIRGKAALQINTGPRRKTVSSYKVDRTTGAVTPNQTIDLEPYTVDLMIGGSLSIGSAFNLTGEFRAGLNPNAFTMVANAAMQVAGVTSRVNNGPFGFYSDGVSAAVDLSLPAIGVPGFFSISGGAVFQINTRGVNDRVTGVPASTFLIGLYDGNANVLGLGLHLYRATLMVSSSGFAIDVPAPGMSLDLGPVHTNVSGYLSSSGEFRLHGSYGFSIDLSFVKGSVGGSIDLSNYGFHGDFSASGSIGVGKFRVSVGPWTGSISVGGGGMAISFGGASISIGGGGYHSPPSQTYPSSGGPTGAAAVELLPSPQAIEGLPVTVSARGVQPGLDIPSTATTYSWRVLRPDGSELTAGSGSRTATDVLPIQFTPMTSGEYRLVVTASTPGYLLPTTNSITIPVDTVIDKLKLCSTVALAFGNPATAGFTGPTGALGVKYSYDFNADGDFTDPGDVLNSASPLASYGFPRPGNYRVQARVTNSRGDSADSTATLTVLPADIAAQPVLFSPVAGLRGSYLVATFADSNVEGVSARTGATIDWGDGQTSTGVVVSRGNGTFAVYGTNTYAAGGSYAVCVTVRDIYGGLGRTGSRTTTLDTLARAELNGPEGLAFDADGNLYVSSAVAGTIRKVTPQGIVSTFADGLASPHNLAFDRNGNLYVANLSGNTVSKITPAGVVTTFASGFSAPVGVAFDASDNLYVANLNSGVVSKVTPGGAVSSFATGMYQPRGLTFDVNGNLYVSNAGDGTVRKVTPGGTVSTYASGLSQPEGLAFDRAGNLFVANTLNDTISKVTPQGGVSGFASGMASPRQIAFNPDYTLFVANANNNTINKVSATGAVSNFIDTLNFPVGLAFNRTGTLFVANSGIGTITRVTPAGAVSTFARGLNSPRGLAFDANNTLYFASGDGTIRRVTPAGTVNTFVSGLVDPQGIAFDANGNLFVSSSNGTISKVLPTGAISTFVRGLDNPYSLAFDRLGNLYAANKGGTTVSKISPEGFVYPIATDLGGPAGVVFDSDGNLIVADHGDARVFSMTPAGTLTPVITNGLITPNYLVFDRNGELFVANLEDDSIGRIGFTPVLPSVTVLQAPAMASTGHTTTAGSTFSGTVATFANVHGFTPAGAVINWGDGFRSEGTIVSDGVGGFRVLGSHAYHEGGNYTPTVQLTRPGTAVAAGGAGGGSYLADNYFTGGSASTTTEVIDTTGVAHPAPLAVYQSQRTGNFSYTLPNLVPGGKYALRLHFAEQTYAAVGSRVFEIAVNGEKVLADFDVFAAAGGKDRAVVRAFDATATDRGEITVTFTSLTGEATLSGVEVLPVVAETSFALTAFDAALSVIANSITSANNTASGVFAILTDANPFDRADDLIATIQWGDGTSSPGVLAGGNGTFTVSGTHYYAEGGTYDTTVTVSRTSGFGIDSGSGTTTAHFFADRDFQGGNTTSTPRAVSTAFVRNAPSLVVFNNERFGDFTYTVPDLTPGATYKVRLDFAETLFHSGNQRLFDVAINGNRVLESYDVFSAAGGANVAVAETYFATADAAGKITLQFTSVVSQATVSGIEIIPAATAATQTTVKGNQLSVTQQPPTAQVPAGTRIAPVTFRILDAFGNPTTSTRKVTVSANGPGGFTPGSTTSVFAVDGYATFDNLVLNTAGDYTLTATAQSVQPVTTASLTVAPTEAVAVRFVQGPALTVAGSALAPAVTVAVVDVFGNRTADGSAVTLTANGPSNLTATVNAVNGLATFGNFVLNSTGNYTLTARSGTLTAATSSSFAIIAAPASVTTAVTNLTATTVTLNGTVNPNAASATVKFVYGTTADLSSGTTTVTVALGVLGTSPVAQVLNLTNLPEATTYYYRIVGVNSVGTTTGPILSFTTLRLPSAVTEPATRIGGDKATLSATFNPNGSATNVTFIYGTASDLSGATTTVPVATGLTGTSAVRLTSDLTGLNSNTTYFYRAVATSAGGTTLGPITSFTTASVIFVRSTQPYANYPTNVTVSGLTNPNTVTLFDAINAANNTAGEEQIYLAAGTNYQLSYVYANYAVGPTALPAVTSPVIIAGNGATISRAASAMRLFYVTAAGNLTLQDVTLSGGYAQGGAGGSGTAGGGGGAGLGGAIWNEGTLRVEGSTFTGNQAVGGRGADINDYRGGGGGGALGGDGLRSGYMGGGGSAFQGGLGGSPNGGAGGTDHHLYADNGGSGGFGAGGGGGRRSSFRALTRGMAVLVASGAAAAEVPVPTVPLLSLPQMVVQQGSGAVRISAVAQVARDTVTPSRPSLITVGAVGAVLAWAGPSSATGAPSSSSTAP